MRRAALFGGPQPASPALLYLLSVALTALMTTAPCRADSTHARAAYDCEGDACAAVTLTWEDETQSFRADNSSARRARVEVETLAGKSSVSVEPGASTYLLVKSFQGPYHALFE